MFELASGNIIIIILLSFAVCTCRQCSHWGINWMTQVSNPEVLDHFTGYQSCYK